MLQAANYGKQERRMRARLKRAKEMQIIKDMKSKVGIIPFEIVPKEIWRLIFADKNLRPEDRWNIARTAQEFYRLLDDNMERDVLFPLIIKFEVRHFWAKWGVSSCCLGYQIRYNNEVCKKPLAIFTGLRSVSKSLRNAVDTWHENNIKLAIENVWDYYYVPSVKLTLRLQNPSNMSKIDRILDNLSNSKFSSESRLFCRSLEIVLFGDVDFPLETITITSAQYKDMFKIFVHKIKVLLAKLGNQIWCFRLVLGSFRRTSFEMTALCVKNLYEILRAWMPLMCKLKWFEIDVLMRYDGTQNQTNEALELPENIKLPQLKDLERISLRCVDSNPGIHKLFLSVLQANPLVKYLCMGDERNVCAKSPEITSFIHSSMCLNGYTSDYHITVRPVLSIRWPLKVLSLNLKPCPAIDKLFEMINTYRTLEHVGLYSSNDISIGFKSQKIVKLQLFKLRIFDFSFSPAVKFQNAESVSFYFGLEFLSCCKSLEKLIFQAYMSHRDARRLFGFMRSTQNNFGMSLFQPKSSKIWDVFPSLNRVLIEYGSNAYDHLYETDSSVRRVDRA